LKRTKILNALDRVLLQEDHLQFLHAFQSLDLLDTIALKPDGLDVSVGVEIFNFAEAFVMQIERII
jgi:hypothetical protein